MILNKDGKLLNQIEVINAQQQTIDTLVESMNYLNDLLKLRNDEISKLRGI